MAVGYWKLQPVTIWELMYDKDLILCAGGECNDMEERVTKI